MDVPWSIAYEVIEMHGLLHHGEASFVHVYRESNQVTDFLADFGS